MAYSPSAVANTILARSFSDNNLITPMKLQRLLYLVASEYAKESGATLLETGFQTWAYGPVDYLVHDKFRPFSRRAIDRYARDAQGNALVINTDEDPALRSALDRVWRATRTLTAVELSDIVRVEGSAWDRAYQRDDDYLNDDEIRADTTYRAHLPL